MKVRITYEYGSFYPQYKTIFGNYKYFFELLFNVVRNEYNERVIYFNTMEEVNNFLKSNPDKLSNNGARVNYYTNDFEI